MKKLFYFILLMAIITAVDHPVINNFYDNTIGRFKMFAREGIKTSKNPGAGRVYRAMEKHFSTYTQAEIEMIEDATENEMITDATFHMSINNVYMSIKEEFK